MPHVVVIGAGVVGAHSAIAARRAGFDVTLIDPDAPGGEQAASFGNAGWLSTHSLLPPAEPGIWRRLPAYILDPLGPLAIRPAYLPRAMPWLLRYLRSGWTEARVVRTAAALRRLLRGAAQLHADIASEAGIPDLIAESGALHVYPDRDGFLSEARAWRIRAAQGVAWQELDAGMLAAREPHLDPSYRFAVHVCEAGHCRDPGAYVAGLVAYAQKQGVRRVTARAVGLTMSGGRLSCVRTDIGDIEADRAVVSAGIRSAPLAHAAGDKVPLDSERGYHVRIEDDGDIAAIGPGTPMMAHDRKVVVTRMRNALRVAGQVEIAGIAAAPNWKRAEILRSHLHAMFPGLPRDLPPERVHLWMGHRPSTPDGLPVIGVASRSRDVVYAFGHGHVGFVSSARTGRLVAGILAGSEPEIDLAPFSPRRF